MSLESGTLSTLPRQSCCFVNLMYYCFLHIQNGSGGAVVFACDKNNLTEAFCLEDLISDPQPEVQPAEKQSFSTKPCTKMLP